MKRNEAGSPPHTTHEAKMDSKEITDLSVRVKSQNSSGKHRQAEGPGVQTESKEIKEKTQIIGFIKN